MAKLSFDDSDGVWRTIGGRRIFIRTGESLSSAMKKSGKFKLSNKKKGEARNENKSFGDLANETKTSLTRDELKKRYGTDDVDLINAGKEKEDRVTLKEDKKELNLTQRQKEAGERLNQKAKDMARDDIKTYLNGNKDNWDSDDDFVRDLANEHNIDREEAQRMFNYQKYVNEKLNDEEYLNANMPAGARFSKMLKENNVRTFADEIKEQNKIETISKAEYDKMPNDYKGTLKELVETAEFRGENKQDLIKQYEKMGYDVDKDKTILVNEKGGTVLKPVKISDNNEKYSVDYFKQRGVEIKDKAPEGWQKLEGTTTAPNGYEWYSNGKSRFGGEYKNALVKKEENNVKPFAEETKGQNAKNNDNKGTKLLKVNDNTFLPVREGETEKEVLDSYIKRQDNYKEYLKSRDDKREKLGISLKDSEYKDVSEELETLKEYQTEKSDKPVNEYINNKLRRKAYQKYLKEHPASKITFEDFKDMRNIK